jgi:hypothetical protein
MEQAQDDELEQAEARIKQNKGKKQQSPAKVSYHSCLDSLTPTPFRSDPRRPNDRAAKKMTKTPKTNLMTSMTLR